MNKRLSSMLFLATLIGPAILSAEEDRVRVGVIAPLSGNTATWGRDVQRSLLFAKKKTGAKHVELLFEDDRCLGKEAVTAAQKLIAVDKIDYGMIVCTESLLAAAPIFEKAEVLVLSPVASGAAVSDAGDYIFRTWPSDAHAARLLYEHLKSKHSHIGVLTEERGYPEELSNAFSEAAENGPLRLSRNSFTSGEADFRPLLLKLRAAGIEGLLLNTNSERTLAAILAQVREIKWGVQLYGVYMPGNQAFLDLAGETAEGIVFVDAPSADGSLTPAGKKLFAEFTGEHGLLQSAGFVFPSSYEAFRRLAAGSSTKGGLRAQLYKETFSGVFGRYSFDDKGDIQGVRHQLKVVRGGTPQLLPSNKQFSSSK